MLLAAHGIGKSFDGELVFDNTSFQVGEGASVAVTSPSGSGKSTLLSIMGLLLEPSEGVVEIDGVDAGTLDDAARSRLRLGTFGFMFQSTQLVASLRAWENVAVPARFAHLHTPAEARDRAVALLESLGLGHRLDYYPHQLSVGQRRRVALARALVLNPPVLIADEPTNDLDAESAQSVTGFLFDHVQNGGTLLYATHDADLASRATRVMTLRGTTFTELGWR